MTASVLGQTSGWECGQVLHLERIEGGGLRYTTVRLLPFVSLDGWACRIPGGLATSRHDQLGRSRLSCLRQRFQAAECAHELPRMTSIHRA
jgi:hypothetical protein